MTYDSLARVSTLRESGGMPEDAPRRRRNAESTKAAILDAAIRAFAEIGYAPAGIRTIAAIARVDSALVQRYFGSKAGLFEAALSQAIPDIDNVEVTPDQMGSTIVADLLHHFLGLRAQAMIVLSTSDPEARLISAQVLRARVIEPLAARLGPPGADARAVRMVMLSTAFMLYTQQVQIMSPQEVTESRTSEWLAQALQQLIKNE